MEEDLISVVIPIYNVEKYLKKCVDSVINQTYKNLEIILVDDGSPDNCGKICDEYAKNDNRIIALHKENGGLSDARNAGIDIAKGKYITFIDSDDYIELNFIEYLYNKIIEYDADISCCQFNSITNYDKKNKEICIKEKIKCFTSIEAIKETLYQRDIDNSACNKLYKTQLFNNIKYPFKKYFEDMDTTYKIFLQSSKIVVTNKKLYNYYQREGSILHKKNEKVSQDLYNIIEDIEKNISEYPVLKKAMKCRKINAYFYIYRNSNDKKMKQKTKKYIKINRRQVLQDKNISKKTKIGIYLSYFGMNLVNIIFELKELLKCKL